MTAVTLLGRGPSWKECPFTTEELWGCEANLVTEGLKNHKYTKVFSFDEVVSEEGKKGIQQAQELGIPIIGNRSTATVPFPLVEIAREFWSSYFMPTMSYMLAYALYLKYDRIFVYGIDQGPRWDYWSGKPHIVFWLGVATGRKVDIRLGRGSLRWAYRLGFDELPQSFFENEETAIATHIGLAIREDEMKEIGLAIQEVLPI